MANCADGAGATAIATRSFPVGAVVGSRRHRPSLISNCNAGRVACRWRSLGDLAPPPKPVLCQAGRGHHDRQGRQPDHPRAVAVVRVGQHAADEALAEQRKRADAASSPSRRTACGARPAARSAAAAAMDDQRHRMMQAVDRGEVDARRAAGGRRASPAATLRRESLDDAVGVPDRS